MREKLQQVAGRRITVHATFSRFGTKPAYKGPPIPTVLLVDLSDPHGNKICDHLWFTRTKGFAALDLKPGDRLAFDGRAKDYRKGYRGRRDDPELPHTSVDYKLSHPTNLRKLGVQPLETLPLFSEPKR